jgi:hypothetical protein
MGSHARQPPRITAREGATDRWPFNRLLSFALSLPHLISTRPDKTDRYHCLRSRDIHSVASCYRFLSSTLALIIDYDIYCTKALLYPAIA